MATWLGLTTNYNLASNWNPADVPDLGESAVFDNNGATTTVTTTTAAVFPSDFTFNAGAPTYNITITNADPGNVDLQLDGAGIVNNSGVQQNLTLDTGASLSLQNSASLGTNLTLTLNSGASLGMFASSTGGSARVIHNGTAIDFRVDNGGGTGLVTMGSLEGTGNVRFAVAAAAQTLQVGSLNTDTTFSGSIEDNAGGPTVGSITKVGTGTLTLSSSLLLYHGATTVSAGTLIVDGTLSNSATTVQANATLGGSGTVANVDVKFDGTLAPGASAGVLTTNDLNLESGSHFAVEIGGTTPGVGGYDQVVVTGNSLILGETAVLDVSFLNGFVPDNGATFTILNKTSAGIVPGTFFGLPQGATVNTPGVDFTINYTGGDGNDIVLTAINAPAVAVDDPGVAIMNRDAVIDNSNDASAWEGQGTVTDSGFEYVTNPGIGNITFDFTGNQLIIERFPGGANDVRSASFDIHSVNSDFAFVAASFNSGQTTASVSSPSVTVSNGTIHFSGNVNWDAGEHFVINYTAADFENVAAVTGSVFSDNGVGFDSDPDTAFSVTAINGAAFTEGTPITLPSGAKLTIIDADLGTFSYDPNDKFDYLPTLDSGASNLVRADTFTYTLTGGDTATVTVRFAGLDGDDTLYDFPGVNDHLVGGNGNDFYFVRDAADSITEALSGGTGDRVFARNSYTLTTGAYIENMSTDSHAGTGAIDLTGNELDNLIFGNAGANTLHGGVGSDNLNGSDGSDILHGDEGDDFLFGGAADDDLFGDAGFDQLHGGAGQNDLTGGADNDWYFIDSASDMITEGTGEGSNDRVFASLSYTLTTGAQVEIMSTTSHAGTAAINLTGNELANIIYGNAGDNILDGKVGADRMIGLTGNDWYYVDNAGDAVTDNVGQGTADRVFASTSWTLTAGAEIENLATTSNNGTAAIDLTGNELANLIYGNAGTNTLDGRAGADRLMGLAGNDTFAFRPGEANGDIVDDFAGNGTAAGDSLRFVGYGTGATFTQINTTHWQVNYNGGASHDIITFSNAAAIDPSDWIFV